MMCCAVAPTHGALELQRAGEHGGLEHGARTTSVRGGLQGGSAAFMQSVCAGEAASGPRKECSPPCATRLLSALHVEMRSRSLT